MDVIVAARVPVEIREQANGVLASMGKTPTQLINAAYQYVLKTGELPEARTRPPRGARNLSREQLLRIEEQMGFMRVSQFDYSDSGAKTLKQALEENRKADYATLA